jgi:hypothetical protein
VSTYRFNDWTKTSSLSNGGTTTVPLCTPNGGGGTGGEPATGFEACTICSYPISDTLYFTLGGIHITLHYNVNVQQWIGSDGFHTIVVSCVNDVHCGGAVILPSAVTCTGSFHIDGTGDGTCIGAVAFTITE